MYPPDSYRRLQDLYQQISSSSSPEHHRKSVLYYLLKDLPQGLCQDPEDFANLCYLPEKYRILVDGLWYLDRLQFERALDYLTEPSLIPTFPEDILNVLCRASLECGKSTDSVVPLPIAYYHTISPPVSSDRTLERYCQVLCRFSITEAFFFSRTQGERNHQVLFERLIHYVLSMSRGDGRGECALELVGLPLDGDEQSWFDDYLRHGKGAKLPGAEDTLIMRDLVVGKIGHMGDLRRKQSERKIGGVSWSIIGGKAEHGQGYESRRRQAQHI